MPRESGMTSTSVMSWTSPWKMPAWIAAPRATTSSGFTDLFGSFPKSSFTRSTIFGIRVCPPTKIISSMSSFLRDDASSARFVISIERSMNSAASSSSFARVSRRSMCFGPFASEVMNGMLISASPVEESSCFAFSAASSRRWSASGSLLKSMPSDFLNSSMRCRTMRWSMSRPPMCASPSVDFTSMTSSPTSRTVTSNVPPPKSYTTIFSSFFLLKPYASAAAVGSLMMRLTSRPAILPASCVAFLWLSLKYAGTVMTASVIFSPSFASASALSLPKIIAEISSGR